MKLKSLFKSFLTLFTALSLILFANFVYAYKAGTYVCSAKGNTSDVKIEVVVDGKKITSIKVLEDKETKGIADTALTRLPEDIVKQQSLAVDGISGATYTSKAVLAAVEECLTKAGGDVAALKVKKSKAAPKALAKESADIIIIGAGGAGMSAAVAAAEVGGSVIILEKMPMIGGNTIRAGGGYNAADPKREGAQKMTEAQMETIKKALAVEPKNDLHKKLIDQVRKQVADYEAKKATYLFDSPEYHALQTYGSGDFAANLALVNEMTQKAPGSIDYLEKLGFEWKDATTTYVGALWPRSHEAKYYKSGFGFIDVFDKAIKSKKYPVKILLETKAESLMLKGKKVVGVKAIGKDGTPYEFTAKKGVIIASGGFGASVSMRMKYDTQWGNLDEKIKTTNSPGITGDGIVMAEAVGANLIDMGYIQLIPGASPETGSTSGFVGVSTSMYVNKEGKRFVNELERRDVLAKAILKQPDAVFYYIGNEKNAGIDKNGLNKYGEDVAALIASGQIIKADTVEGLASKLKMPADNLTETVRKWNESCKTQKDPDFGRQAFAEGVCLYEGPYYATIRTPAVHHTMGGLQINEKARVIDKNGKTIEGLWAAGEVTGGIHGANRVGANAIPDALVFGRIAGLDVMKKK